MKRFTSTKLFRVILISTFFIFLIVINPAGAFNPFAGILSGIISPFQKVAYSFSVGTENFRDFIFSIGQLKSENEKIIRRNQELIAENSNLRDLQNENNVLRSQLELLPRGKFDLVGANVIGNDPGGLGSWIYIDKGSKDGLLQGMPVIFSKGILVGKIENVQETTASVMLLTNPKSIINAISVSSDAKGVVRGEYGLGMILDMVLQTDSLSVGGNVVTSGIGGDIPRGFFIGTIQDVHPSEDHLFQQASIISPIENSKLEVVFVVKKER